MHLCLTTVAIGHFPIHFKCATGPPKGGTVCAQSGDRRISENGDGRLYKRGNVWWASVYIDGVEVRRRGGSKREAEKVLARLRRERESGRPHVALSDVLRSYRRDLAVRAKPNTLRTYDESIRNLEDYFGTTFNVPKQIRVPRPRLE